MKVAFIMSFYLSHDDNVDDLVPKLNLCLKKGYQAFINSRDVGNYVLHCLYITKK